MEITLYHKHYDQNHLDKVTAEMQELGAPAIRAIWSEVYGTWMAVEGCHRLRAAETLGLTPEIIDIGTDETSTHQIDGSDETVNVIDLLEELQDAAWQSVTLEF